MSENSQYREMFVQESHEHIEELNQSLLNLEKEPESREHIDSLFRAAHTLKGMAATMGYDQIRQLCMQIEELFDKLRNGNEKITTNLASSLFSCFDLLREMIDDENKKVDLEPYLQQLQNPDANEGPEEAEHLSAHSKSQTIRVKMEDLDALVNLVGELVIAKMRLEQTIPSASDETHQMLMSLRRLIADLQYQTMKVRLVPVELIFNRFPRMVRDLATKEGKDVIFETDGAGIELDRTVLDAITDPLLHMLRNSIDHGIEAPSEREKAGKPRSGTVRLTAYRVGDMVAIQIKDDGKGIDIEGIKQRAIEKNIISASDAAQMPDEKIVELLGTPGLSSASNVTDVSGRGVGLDVVFRQVESVGGHVKIDTTKGVGTSMKLIIPMSLAIIEGLLIKVAGERYVMPLTSITTTVSVDRSEIKTVQGKEVMILRDQTIPLVRTDQALGISAKAEAVKQDGSITVVIVDKGGKPYGLIVDSFENMQEIVTKRIDNNSSSNLSDATILADGTVVLILEPAMLV